AVVEAATTPRQRTLRATLATLPALARAARLRPPATLVVGPVVALSQAAETDPDLGADPEPVPARAAPRQRRSGISSRSDPIVGPSQGSSSGR
ncbi:MAG TPA: hypothetical protein VNO79_12045, partial [Actinomycetota bacterium]|nr:hypothetical protein [Actinomycetota bacterium]